MGTRYSSVAISGFNANPPSDDGAQTSSNQLQWSKHISKVGTPLKNMAESINSAIITALDTSCRLITSSDSALASDHWKTIQIGSTVTAAITVTLPDAATMLNGYIVTVTNQSLVTHTIGRATASNTIDTKTLNVQILPLSSITFIVNAAAAGYISFSQSQPVYQCYDICNEEIALTTDDFRTVTLPSCVLLDCYTAVGTDPSSSGDITIDFKKVSGVTVGNSVFTTKPVIQSGEYDSTTGTRAVLSQSEVVITGPQRMKVIVDGAGTGATGVKFYLAVKYV